MCAPFFRPPELAMRRARFTASVLLRTSGWTVPPFFQGGLKGFFFACAPAQRGIAEGLGPGHYNGACCAGGVHAGSSGLLRSAQ